MTTGLTDAEIFEKVVSRILDFDPLRIYRYDELSDIGLGTLIRYLRWDTRDGVGLVFDPKHWHIIWTSDKPRKVPVLMVGESHFLALSPEAKEIASRASLKRVV